jgi:hypothetical protein
MTPQRPIDLKSFLTRLDRAVEAADWALESLRIARMRKRGKKEAHGERK